ncbi:helix-turn-helix transcriptional regulator [Gordonia hongkongensis]|uniref:helix-turn-helix domain-containing protein n=1 Tax=Gordonia hongkongensis TaxID=1701090 RepID=UPI0030D46CC7
MKRITDEQIGSRIVQLRDQRGWNQGQLAEALRASGLNWSQGTLSKVETGTRPVRLAEVSVLVDVLQAKVDDLIDLDVDPNALSDTTRSGLQDRLVDLQGAATNVEAIRFLADATERLVESTSDTIQLALMRDSLAQADPILGDIREVDLGDIRGDDEIEDE